MRLVAWVTVLLGAASLTRFADPAFAIDDAWISFRTARNMLEHGVLTFDVTRPAVEGVTNLLWTLLSTLWIAAWPLLDPIVAARALGGLLHLGTLALAVAFAGRLAARFGANPPVAAAVTGLLLATSGTLAFHAISGLETALFGALFVLSLWLLDGALRGHGGAARAGLVLGLLAATRPEGVLVGGLLLGALAVHRSTAKLSRSALVPFVLLVAAMEVFRLLAYGALVPNTFAAKPPDPWDGTRYLAGALLYGLGGAGPLLLAPLLSRFPPARVVVAVLALLALGVAWSGGDWMPGARRLTLPILVFAVGAGPGVLLVRGGRRVLALLGVGLWLLGSFVAAAQGWDAMRQAPLRAQTIAQVAARTPGLDDVALADVGVFGWWFDHAIFDIVGLTDAHIAHLPGDHGSKVWDEAYFRARAPDLVLVRSETPVTDPLRAQPTVGATDRPILLSILDHGGYRYHACLDLDRELGRYLLVFTRDGLELPVELWGRPAERDLRDLLVELGGG